MMKTADWYFDFISPFAYLQMARFDEISRVVNIRPVPVVFGGLLKHWKQLGPAEIPPKRTFVYRYFQWQADRLGLPFQMPPSHPYNPLPSLRLCLAAGAKVSDVRAVYDAIYGRGMQPDGPEAISEMAKALGILNAEAALADDAVKATLRQNTQQAIEAGVFGVPTFVLEGQIFWGGDATDMMLDFAANPELFEGAEMTRISEMPMGVMRQR